MRQKLDLLLVNVGNRAQVYGKLGSSLVGIEPPFWAGLIAAFIQKHGYTVKIIDAEAENWDTEYTAGKIAEYNPLLGGIIVLGPNPSASSTPKMTAAGEILTALKKKSPHIKTMLGGLHPSALPERTLREENADFVCEGEGFYTILQLLNVLKSDKDVGDYKIKGLWYIKDGKVISNHRALLIENLDELPFVAWDLLPMDKYRAHNWHCFGHIDQRQPYAVVYTSLGCPFNCSYCNIHALYGGKPCIRFRSPEKIVEEIDFLTKNYKIKNIKIMDELFALGEERVIRICDLIIKRSYDLNMWAYARVDTLNKIMLKKMKQAGINWLGIGFESGSKNIRDRVSKGRFSDEKIRKVVNMIHEAGIYVGGNFIFGLPDDNLQTMQETLNLAKELNCEYTNFYVAMAYPGSKLYEEALANNLPLPDSWVGYSQFGYETQPLPTKYLTPVEILRFRDDAFNEFYSSQRYQNMILEKFGENTLQHINDMLKYKLKRRLLGD